MLAPVVFLDKDGTLIEDVPYNADPFKIRLVPGAGEAAQTLHAARWRLAVVTNQSGVARGHFREAALAGVEARIRELLAEFSVPLAGFYYCPHHPEGIVPGYAIECECRKPAPGLILLAARQLGVDPRDCWMIGDSRSDVEAGQRAGCWTILLGNAGSEPHPTLYQHPHFLATDVAEAAQRVVRRKSRTEEIGFSREPA